MIGANRPNQPKTRSCKAVTRRTELPQIFEWYSVQRGQYRGSKAPPLSASQQLQLDLHPPDIVTKHQLSLQISLSTLHTS